MSDLIEDNEITQKDLDTLHRTLLLLAKRTEKKTPWKINYIKFLEDAMCTVPINVNHIK